MVNCIRSEDCSSNAVEPLFGLESIKTLPRQVSNQGTAKSPLPPQGLKPFRGDTAIAVHPDDMIRVWLKAKSHSTLYILEKYQSF